MKSILLGLALLLLSVIYLWPVSAGNPPGIKV
jgi:hypothetical protein